MTHKTSPIINRISIIRDWKSRWISAANYAEQAEQDYIIRRYVYANYKNAGIESVDIERFANSLSVVIYTSRPGILIGRGGSGLEEMKGGIIRALMRARRGFKPGVKKTNDGEKKIEIRLEVREIRNIETHAALVAQSIAEQLERRMPFRRVIKRTLDRVMANKEVKGIKISAKGRLNGAEMARTEVAREGSMPLSTLRADIDFAHVNALTSYGVIGVKVWIYRGDKLE